MRNELETGSTKKSDALHLYDVQEGLAEHIMAGVNVAELDVLGRVLLVIDEKVIASISADLIQLEDDLVGDGWVVERIVVPRHEANWASNVSLVKDTRIAIKAARDRDPLNTKAAILIGHVPVPYSGHRAVDGHTTSSPPDHQGAWPADTYYAEIDGTWTDSSVNYDNQGDFALNDNFPDDGKFDQDYVPWPSLALAVGRIDFAGLPQFGTGDTANTNEVNLLKGYLAKNHRYRHKQIPWQTDAGIDSAKAIVYSTFPVGNLVRPTFFHNAMQSSAAVFGKAPGKLVVGDPITRRDSTYLFAFQAGNGTWNGYNLGSQTEHWASDLAIPANEPKAVFTLLTASYMGDWNTGPNNYLRSLLTARDHCLGSFWSVGSVWRFDATAVGEYIGMSLVRMVNASRNAGYTQDTGHGREHAVLGDPTLRARIIAPPTQLNGAREGSMITLNWGAGEPGSTYHIYRSSSTAGPFSRISTGVTGNSYSDPVPLAGTNHYLVRGVKTVIGGSGSFMSISQGAKAAIP